MPTFPGRAAAALGVDPDLVAGLIRGPFRDDYWGGRLPEPAFWQRLGVVPPTPADRARILALAPRIEPARVAAWRQHAEVWIISNHRREWLAPVLAATGLDTCVDCVLISSDTGLVKPDPAAWAVLLADGTDPADVLVVDDQQRNRDAAEGLGITAVAATGDLGWCDAVDAFLAARGG